MATYNGKEGRWVTSNGRHIFISDDPTEKQEQEIKAQEEQTKKLTDEKKAEQIVKKDKLDDKETADLIKWWNKQHDEDGEDNVYPSDLLQEINEEWGYGKGIEVNTKNVPINFVYNVPEQDEDGEGTYWGWTFDHNLSEKDYKQAFRFIRAYADKGEIYVDLAKKVKAPWEHG
jgi:hypothetical protein